MREPWSPPPSSASDVDLALAYAAPEADLAPTPFGRKAFFGRAVLACTTCIAGGGAIDGVGYVVSFHDRMRDLPVVAALYVLFVIVVGMALGVGAGAGILGADAMVARLLPGRVASPLAAVIGATLGSAVLVIVPSALGTLYFGSRSSPYVGNAAIAVVPILAVLLASAMIAGADARLQGRTIDRGVLATLAVVALLPLGALGVAVAAIDDQALPRWADHFLGSTSSPTDYALRMCGIGAVLGTVLGATLGLHIGVTTALARWRSIA